MPDLYVAKDKKKKEKKPEKEARKTEEKEIEKPEIDLEETSNPVSAFATKPIGVHFETQDEKEEIILLLRRHWVTNVPWVLLGVFLIFAPLVLTWFPFLDFLPPRYKTIAMIIWYLLTIIIIFEKFLSWYFNVHIITDERIVDVDFHNLIYKEVSDTKIDKVQDITYKMGGFARTLFHFGDVYIQTAGAEPNFDFLAVPNPEQVVKILDKLREQEEKEFFEGRTR